MIALRIEDIRQFTAKLFVGETFDHFLIKEAEIVTFNVFTIDGHIRQGYYSEEELEENQMEELSSWKMIRPYCLRGRSFRAASRLCCRCRLRQWISL